jgi:hypothetical protein
MGKQKQTAVAETFRRSRRTGQKPYHMRFEGAPSDAQIATIVNYLRKYGVSVSDDPKTVKVPKGVGLHVQGQADSLKYAGFTIVRVG